MWKAHLRRDTILPCQSIVRIDIDLDKGKAPRLGLGGCKLREDWRDCFAGTAPVGVEIDHHMYVAAEDLLEMAFGGDGGDCHLAILGS